MGRSNKTRWAAGEKPKPEDMWRKLPLDNELVPVRPVLYTKIKGIEGIGHRRYMAGEINNKLIVDPITHIPIPYKSIGLKPWTLKEN
jgi:hypothetical protein